MVVLDMGLEIEVLAVNEGSDVLDLDPHG